MTYLIFKYFMRRRIKFISIISAHPYYIDLNVYAFVLFVLLLLFSSCYHLTDSESIFLKALILSSGVPENSILLRTVLAVCYHLTLTF